VERAGEDVAVETAACFEEGIRTFNVVADEWGELLTSFAIRDSKEVSWGMREVDKVTLKVALPARARVSTGLRLPVFFIVVEAFGPIGGR
jgi:hypothetical protein